jgi:nitrate/nitrite transporter NarK
MVGFVSMILSAIIIMMAALNTDNQHAAVLLAIGMAVKDFTLPVAFAACVDIGKNRSGVVAGAMNMAGQLGAFFLAVLFGKVVDLTGDYNIPLYFIAIVLFLGGLLWLLIDAEKPVFESAH